MGMFDKAQDLHEEAKEKSLDADTLKKLKELRRSKQEETDID